MPINNQITFRKGSSSLWTSTNPILASGEPGYETDTGRFKIGNGSNWNSTNYTAVVPSGFIAGTGISISLGSNGSTATITSTGSGILSDQAKSLVTTVFNNTGSSIPKMTAVYINGGQGDTATIQKAIATGDLTSAGTYGLTYQNIDNMSTGQVIVFGALTGLNTDQFNPTAPVGNINGTVLYLSPTTSGALTTTKPSAPNHIVAIGTVVRTHQNEGVIEVRVQNGFELEELHNVAISGVTNGQFLQYNSASGLWLASSSGTFSTLNVSGNLAVSSTGDINTLKINNFFHNNLSVAAGIGDNDLLITIADPTGSPTTQVIQGGVLRSSLLNQPAVLRFRQGTETERLLITPASGEPIWTTDSQRFYIGDGTTVGGDFIGPSLYNRGSGIQSIVSLNTGCAASGNYSVVNGGINNSSIGTNSVVGGGIANTSSGNNSVVGGGNANTSSGTNSVVGGGGNNTSSGSSNTISGGSFNNSSSSFSTVGGGYSNISSATNSTVSGGSTNTSSGNNSVVGGGTNNTSSGISSTISGGQANLARSSRSFVSGSNNVASSTVRRANNITSSTNTITVLNSDVNDFDDTTSNALQIRYFYNNAWNLSRRTVSSAVQSGNNVTLTLTSNVGSAGQTWSEVSVVNTSETETMVGGTVNGVSNICSNNHSTVGGGRSNTSSGSYSIIPGGTSAKTTRHGELSHSAGAFDSIGDAQHTILVARGQTTDATPNQVLLLDNSSARLTLPASTAWTFSIKLSAYNNTDNESGWWIIRGGIRRNHNNATTLVGSLITESGFESSLNAASVSVVADDTNEALEIRVTGISDKIIRWVAVVDISQVSFGTP